MARTRTALACSACGQQVPQWVGRCPGCGEWGTIGEPAATMAGAPVALGQGHQDDARVTTGFEGLDRVLGGGLVPGSVVLVAGEPGIGKSTLLLQVVAKLAAEGRPCLYASGEESRSQVAARARRLSLPPDVTAFVGGRDLPAVLEAIRTARPAVAIVDSIQALRDPASTTLPGGASQVRACADALVGVAKADGVTVILAGQVTKDGEIAGPRTLEHAVDVVCSFEGDPRTGLRVLAGGKNRFGPEGEVAWMEMGPAGLAEVSPQSVLAPSDGEAGAATALVVVGRRAVAVEVQALAGDGDGPGRRYVSGLDQRRFGLVAAVVDRAAGLRLHRCELYGSAAGGLRVDDPGTDLAVAAALVSAATGVPVPKGSAFVGEVSLTGSVKPAPNLGARLAAAAASGVATVIGPAGDAPDGVRLRAVRHVRDALWWAWERRDRSVRTPTRPPASDRKAS